MADVDGLADAPRRLALVSDALAAQLGIDECPAVDETALFKAFFFSNRTCTRINRRRV